MRYSLRYEKPSVNEPGSEWETLATRRAVQGGAEVSIARQRLNTEDEVVLLDHYAIYINGKRQRRTYFGESARHEVARKFNDMIHWTAAVYGDEL